MWAHYTTQHVGFVIGFDTDHSVWNAMQRRLGSPGEPTKVSYSTVRPVPMKIADMTPEHIWYIKSSEWEYEQEWRVTRLVRTAVSQVILGCRADNALEGELKQVLRDPAYRNCQLLRAELDKHTFRLNIVP